MIHLPLFPEATTKAGLYTFTDPSVACVSWGPFESNDDYLQELNRES